MRVSDCVGRADAFLLGRRTYEFFAEYWSQVAGFVDDQHRAGSPR
jgi:ADP-ribose pyrophosphatase YjhB (NUDIX family)